MSTPLLGYWNCRGIAEPIRYLLHHVGHDYEEKKYQFGEAPDFEPTKEWTEVDKKQMPLDFPNLPYWIDGDIKLTQSLTILRHLARQFGLIGKPEDILRVELAEQQAVDMRTSLVRMAYDHATFEASKKARHEALPNELKQFTDFLGNRKFIAGDYVTYVDFILYDALDFHKMFDEVAFNYTNVINDYMKRIESLPNVAKHMSSPSYNRSAFSPFARWEGKV